jgi:membrane-bound lytic murein transglycosylase B
MRAALIAALCLCALLGTPASAASARPLRPEIAEFIEEVAAKHQYDRALLRRAFAEARPRPGILRAMAAPGTARPWHVFRARYIDDVRIAAGVSFWRQHARALRRAAREFGVPEEVIVATIGVETIYGRDMGSFRVLEALMTLAFDYPPRAAFFRSELEQFVLLAREARLDLLRVRGSYAGAIGIPQFLPSSYRKYAVDYDRDGIVDLVGSPADAVGSVANYYRAFGWETGGAVALRITADEAALDGIVGVDVKPHVRVAELRRRGAVVPGKVSDETEVAVFSLEAESGTQYWLGLHNFYVITRYNRSVNYAMVVHELARELRAALASGTDAVSSRPGTFMP